MLLTSLEVQQGYLLHQASDSVPMRQRPGQGMSSVIILDDKTRNQNRKSYMDFSSNVEPFKDKIHPEYTNLSQISGSKTRRREKISLKSKAKIYLRTYFAGDGLVLCRFQYLAKLGADVSKGNMAPRY